MPMLMPSAQNAAIEKLVKCGWTVSRWPTDDDDTCYLHKRVSRSSTVYCEVEPDGTVN